MTLMPRSVVLITGASSGFGEACAEHLARLGYSVYGTSRRASFPEGGAERNPRMIPMDVCDDASVRAAVDFVLAEEGRLDVVVNNAGLGMAGAVEDTSVEEAKALFETNFFGMHRVCRAVLPTLRAQRSGLIVNISSIGGLIAIPFQGFYSASKFATEALTEALRMELMPFGIRVTLLEPGDFKTDFTDNRVFAGASSTNPAYQAICTDAVAVMEHDERRGGAPMELARTLAMVIEKRSPRPRYAIGMLAQRLAVWLHRLLPNRLFEKGIMVYYKVKP
jgi:NAD(P)-dependent dehydrogenase (short-subunit alcohol dehydrogenase family)